jgi:hypothetical protein
MEVSRLEEKLVEVSDELARRGSEFVLEGARTRTNPQQTTKNLSSARKSQGNKFNM